MRDGAAGRAVRRDGRLHAAAGPRADGGQHDRLRHEPAGEPRRPALAGDERPRVSVEPGVPGHVVQERSVRGHQVTIQHDAGQFGKGQIIWRLHERLAGRRDRAARRWGGARLLGPGPKAGRSSVAGRASPSTPRPAESPLSTFASPAVIPERSGRNLAVRCHARRRAVAPPAEISLRSQWRRGGPGARPESALDSREWRAVRSATTTASPRSRATRRAISVAPRQRCRSSRERWANSLAMRHGGRRFLARLGVSERRHCRSSSYREYLVLPLWAALNVSEACRFGRARRPRR